MSKLNKDKLEDVTGGLSPEQDEELIRTSKLAELEPCIPAYDETVNPEARRNPETAKQDTYTTDELGFTIVETYKTSQK